MFDSFARGFKMIWASMKMAWQDQRLLLPSVLTVFTNLIFGALVAYMAVTRLRPKEMSGQASLEHFKGSLLSGGLGRHPVANLSHITGLNGPLDQSGIGAHLPSQLPLDTHTALIIFAMVALWWLTNRVLEGVTTALVYEHLTEGPGEGKISEAIQAVFASLPAIITLGIVTFIARRLAGWMRNQRSGGIFGFGLNFLAGIVEIFWTLAGHLILPAIVIEGTSFWGALKRADRIAQGNLVAIGVGEVGVDIICRIGSGLVYLGGLAGFGYAWYTHIFLTSPQVIIAASAWALSVVLVTAASIYIRAAFYTCLYVWAIDAEAVHETERARIRPPAPLAQALA